MSGIYGRSSEDGCSRVIEMLILRCMCRSIRKDQFQNKGLWKKAGVSKNKIRENRLL